MDFIVNLPKSGPFNAIWVVVDRFMKHAQFVPITTGLTVPDFTEIFVHIIASRYGLPDSIISDWDARWTSECWRNLTSLLHIRLAMSSAHHPQHDGQTEIVNRTLETMLQAYTAQSKSSWADWLHLMEFTYNSTTHSSTGYSPFQLLYGFEPKQALDFLGQAYDERMTQPQTENFLKELQTHHEMARQAIAWAQEKQAVTYNKGHKPCEFKSGDLVLVNPHELEWSEAKGEGAKLVQQWIGPFKITKQINPKMYRLQMDDRYQGMPIFSLDLSRPGQLQNYLQNVWRLVSDGTWLQQLGEERCALVKSLSQISEHGDNLEVRLQRCTVTKSSNVQRRVRDSSGGSEGSGILVDIQTEGNTWLGGTVLILRRCTGLVAENGAE